MIFNGDGGFQKGFPVRTCVLRQSASGRIISLMVEEEFNKPREHPRSAWP